ncbi:hypothetical protein [Telmatospirillum sp.]|uniref:hypothetical protein n=1 Tax=Telmatospirillum sp. TaxID=2079197 RepID=UPI00284C6DA4|nr:hypothetical protein [Telmatospirillum sp.]MDR3439404.1 hypothetical protein [Telmatospirillum sp.]
MIDRKALSHSLHGLHNSDLGAGKDGMVLKDAISKIIDAIEAAKAGLTEADSRHLAEAIEALAEGQEFLARSSILLILEEAETLDGASHEPALTLAQLRAMLAAVQV